MINSPRFHSSLLKLDFTLITHKSFFTSPRQKWILEIFTSPRNARNFYKSPNLMKILQVSDFFDTCKIFSNVKRKTKNEKRKKEDNSTRGSQAVTHPSTNRAQRCLTSVIGRELVFSAWYGRCRRWWAKLFIIILLFYFFRWHKKREKSKGKKDFFFSFTPLPQALK